MDDCLMKEWSFVFVFILYHFACNVQGSDIINFNNLNKILVICVNKTCFLLNLILIFAFYFLYTCVIIRVTICFVFKGNELGFINFLIMNESDLYILYFLHFIYFLQYFPKEFKVLQILTLNLLIVFVTGSCDPMYHND